MAKERSSNLELYRILVMLTIVAHHYVVNSGIMDVMEEDPTSWCSIYYYVFGAWGKVGINCFVLITGYFMCKSEITVVKFLKLFFEVWFYKIAITTIFLLAGYTPLGMKSIILSYLPIIGVKDGFSSCFILFYLFIPFLNILVRGMNRRQHEWLLILTVGIYTILGTILGDRVSFNYVTWFCVLYFISSYIRLYQPLTNMRWGLLGGVILTVSVVSILVILFAGKMIGRPLPQYYFISDSNKLLAVALSISLFMWFKSMRVPQSRIINRVAQSCFGVLLIHANSDTMREWLWKDVLDVAGQYGSGTFVLHSIISVLGIYVICTIVDQARIVWIERPVLKWVEEITSKWQQNH